MTNFFRRLRRGGCRISGVLALKVGEVDFERGTVTILYLKTRVRTFCPQCNKKLLKSHTFCVQCGAKVEKIVVQTEEERRARIFLLDIDTLAVLREYTKSDGFVSRSDAPRSKLGGVWGANSRPLRRSNSLGRALRRYDHPTLSIPPPSKLRDIPARRDDSVFIFIINRHSAWRLVRAYPITLN